MELRVPTGAAFAGAAAGDDCAHQIAQLVDCGTEGVAYRLMVLGPGAAFIIVLHGTSSFHRMRAIWRSTAGNTNKALDNAYKLYLYIRMRRLPPLAAVRVFEAAARVGNFTRAAEELGMTQAAVSYQVKLLEE